MREDKRPELAGLRIFGGSVGEQYGIPRGAELLAVDGRAIRTRADAERAIDGYLLKPPRSVRLKYGPVERHVHYVSDAVVKRLWRQGKTLLDARRRPPLCLMRGRFSIQIGRDDYTVDPTCTVDTTREWQRLATAIEAAARQAQAPRGASGEFSCRELGEMPTSLAVIRGDRHVEVRFVDWLVRRMRDRPGRPKQSTSPVSPVGSQ